MLIFTNQQHREGIIIFVHGLNGGKETWQAKKNRKSLANFLQEDNELSKYFDFAVFEYYTKVFDFFSPAKQLISLTHLFDFSKNLEINLLADILKTEIEEKCESYTKIVFVAHSMGGLVTKSYLLKRNAKNAELFISIAVPHRGAVMARHAKVLFRNPHLIQLQPLNRDIDTLERDWHKNRKMMPSTAYLIASYDQVVNEISANPLDTEPHLHSIHKFQHDHFSIVRPISDDDSVVRLIKRKCVETFTNSPTNNRYDKIFSSQQNQEILSAEFRKNQIRVITEKLLAKLDLEVKSTVYFERDFMGSSGTVFSYDELKTQVINSEYSLLYGIGGSGKSFLAKKIMVDLATSYKNPLIIFCDSKLWKNNGAKTLVESESFDDKLNCLLRCFDANINFEDFTRLNLNKYDPDINSMIFVDGINEISENRIRENIIKLLRTLKRDFRFKIVVTTRYYHKDEFREFSQIQVDKVNGKELKNIIKNKFEEDIDDRNIYSERNIKYLSIPYFLDIALKSGKRKIYEYSSYIYDHVLKSIETNKHAEAVAQLSEAAYCAFQNNAEKLVITDKCANAEFKNRFVRKYKILSETNRGLEFEHHLVNEFLVAYKIANNNTLWNETEFNLITLEDRKSFEVIQMILEQIPSKPQGDNFLKSVYDWSFYATLHCLKNVEDKYSTQFATVITLVLTEKIFDKFSHTKTAVVSDLKSLIAKFEIKGLTGTRVEDYLNLNYEEGRRHFHQILSLNEFNFKLGEYSSWFNLFSKSTLEDDDFETIGKIIKNDPLTGWSCANLLKRSSLTEKHESLLIAFYYASEYYTQRWRIVHALGSSSSDRVSDFLLNILLKNESIWISYGSIRSITEMIIFNLDENKAKLLTGKLYDTINSTVIDKHVVNEMLLCLSGKVSESKYDLINKFFETIMTSTHTNFMDKKPIELAFEKFKLENGKSTKHLENIV